MAVTKIRKRPTRKTEVAGSEEASTGPAPMNLPVVPDTKAGGMNQKYEWEPIRRDFIEGIERADGTKNERWFPNLREVADLHNVPYARIRKRSAQERWTNKRAAAEQVYHQKRAEGRAKMIARNALDFDDKAFQAAKLGMAMVTTRMAEIAGEVQARKPRRDQAWQDFQNGLPVEKTDLYSAVRANEINELASALDRLQASGMKALGTDVQRIDLMNSGGDTVNILNVTQEVQRDDPERLAAILGAMGEAGMFSNELLQHLEGLEDPEDNVIEGEVEEDESDDYFTDDLDGTDTEKLTDPGSVEEILGS